MKVIGQQPSRLQELNTGKAQQAAKNPRDAAQQREDRAAGSSTESGNFGIGRIKNAVQNAPDVRQAKIEALKSRLKDGTYQVDTDQLAGRMIDQTLQDIKDRV